MKRPLERPRKVEASFARFAMVGHATLLEFGEKLLRYHDYEILRRMVFRTRIVLSPF